MDERKAAPWDDETTQPMRADYAPWLSFARGKIGTHELPGAADDPFVVECLRMAGLPPGMQRDETAWCGAFAGRCMRESGITPPKGYAGARRWLAWGEPLAAPVEGAVVILWRGSPSAATGHVAFWAGREGVHEVLLGGNQGNAVRLARYPRARVLGYRWPTGRPLPSRGA